MKVNDIVKHKNRKYKILAMDKETGSVLVAKLSTGQLFVMSAKDLEVSTCNNHQ